jgi:hypothetical protein
LELWSFAYDSKKTLPGAQVTVGGCTTVACTSVQGSTNDEGYVKMQTTKQVSYVFVSAGGGAQFLFPQINYASWYAFSGDRNADRNIYAKQLSISLVFTRQQVTVRYLNSRKIWGEFKRSCE